MKKYLFPLFIAASLLLGACAPSDQQTAGSPTSQPLAKTGEPSAPIAEATSGKVEKIPVAALKNATYSGIYDEPVTLTNGLYKGESYVEGDPSRPMVEYLDGTERYSDLDGDGVEDAIVFLVERGGGSGAFVHIAAQLNRGGQAVDGGAVWIEDRIGVKSVSVENGQVMMEIITQGPGDPACCGTHKVQKIYTLQNGKLTDISLAGGEPQQISAADLNGTFWTLAEIDNDKPAAEDVPVNIEFIDNQVSGFGGCNNYNASFELGEDNPFAMTISPIASTKKACPDPAGSQETTYLTALESVTSWIYDFGRLALNYTDASTGEQGRLLFDPGPVPEFAQSSEPRLTGQTWQWSSFTSPVDKIEIESPENYTVTFNADGNLNIKADCNRANADYKDEAGALQIKVGPSTLSLCPDESRSENFIQYLGYAARYFFQEGRLYIDLFADGGTMEFVPSAQ